MLIIMRCVIRQMFVGAMMIVGAGGCAVFRPTPVASVDNLAAVRVERESIVVRKASTHCVLVKNGVDRGEHAVRIRVGEGFTLNTYQDFDLDYRLDRIEGERAILHEDTTYRRYSGRLERDRRTLSVGTYGELPGEPIQE